MDEHAPIYYQIADGLEAQILAEKFLPRDKLPSENELVEIYQVSRLTIRRALSELERKGLIYRRHGIGTFVSPHPQLNTFGFGGFTERCQNLGLEVSTEVLNFEIIEDLPLYFTKVLQFTKDIYPDNRYFMLERVRKIKNKSVAFETAYLPLWNYPALEDQYDPKTSLYQFLYYKYKIKRLYTHSIILPYLASGKDAEHYSIPEGLPLSEVYFSVWGKTQQILEYTHSFYTREFPLRFRWEE
ncbi:MAG: GntR family transcriptional regulator [Flexilinea sp.]